MPSLKRFFIILLAILHSWMLYGLSSSGLAQSLGSAGTVRHNAAAFGGGRMSMTESAQVSGNSDE
jgi:hypothetical protein